MELGRGARMHPQDAIFLENMERVPCLLLTSVRGVNR
jgi:hypothetical protein